MRPHRKIADKCIKLCAVLLGLLVLLQPGDPALAASPTLLEGPIAGDVTATTASVWLRTTKKAKVYIKYSTQPDLANALASAVGETKSKQKFATRIQMTGLAPQTRYYFQVVLGGTPQPASPYPTFTTFATRGTSTDFHFGILTDFGSNGATKAERPLPLDTFKQIAAEDPTFILIGGDFWHNEQDSTVNPATSRQDFVARTRERYHQMYSHQSTQGPYNDFVDLILPRFALAHFWDDHDIGRNNTNKYFQFKVDALNVLRESFPTYPMSRYGDWQLFSYGQADFFILDARSQRDSIFDPDGASKSMLDGDNLGKAGQWQWLTNNLAASTARWKIILSPVVFNPTMKKQDTWLSFKSERGRLLKFLRKRAIQGVFIISGDAHAGAIDDGTNSNLPEMLVPGANMKWSCFTASSTGTWSNGIYGALENTGCPGYGMVYIYTNPDRAVLQVKDDHGAVKLEMELQ